MAPVAPVMARMILKSQIPNPKSQLQLPVPRRGYCARSLGSGIWDLGFGISIKAIIDVVLRRQRTGSVICTSCGVLVGVDDDRCYNCNRRNPGLWGWAPALRSLGGDLGFVPFVIGSCIIVYALMLVFSQGQIGMGGMLSLFSPSRESLFLFGASGAVPVFGAGRWWTVLSAGWLHGGVL